MFLQSELVIRVGFRQLWQELKVAALSPQVLPTLDKFEFNFKTGKHCGARSSILLITNLVQWLKFSKLSRFNIII